MTSPWFEGVTEPSDPVYIEFLGVLRNDEDWHWSARGLRPEDTSFMDWGTVLVVMIDVPWVGAGYRNLQIGYAGTSAECGWGDNWVLDGFVDGTDLERSGASAAGMARLVGNWVVEQLARPVERTDWRSRDGRTRASSWRLGDSGARLGVTGGLLRRAFLPPSSTRRVDPAGAGGADRSN